MKRFLIRGVFTVCAALLIAGICHAQGGGGGGGGRESARDRHASEEAQRRQRHREVERERRLRDEEARRAASERRRERRLYEEERQREEFLKEQERAREAEQRRRELDREADHRERELKHEEWLREREELRDLREEDREALLEQREREREEFLKWQERQRERWSDRNSDGQFDDAGQRPHPGHRPDWDAQRANEARKLQNQLDQADHLRRISEHNGNPRLAEIAERMEQRALDHYERRLTHIDQLQSAAPGASPASVAEPLGGDWSEFSDAYQRRLFNEEQILRQRLATADRMRQLGEVYRDPQLIDEAARIEDAALASFDQRMQELRGPLTPVQQVQLDQYLEQSIASALEYELDDRFVRPIHETVIQPIDDLEHAILDQPVRYLIEDVSDWLGR